MRGLRSRAGNVGYRCTAVVDGAALNVGKWPTGDRRSATPSGSLAIHCGHPRLDGCSALFSGHRDRRGGDLYPAKRDAPGFI